MHKPSEPSPERVQIKLGDDDDYEVDEEIAPLIADILNETTLKLYKAQVVERKTGARAVDFVFPDPEDASSFMSLLGTVWEEQQDHLRCAAGEVDYLEGWGIRPITYEPEFYAAPVDEDGEPMPLDEVDEEDLEPCDCGDWHIQVGICVSIPADTVPEFIERLKPIFYPEELQDDIRAEFDGIAGLDEFF